MAVAKTIVPITLIAIIEAARRAVVAVANVEIRAVVVVVSFSDTTPKLSARVDNSHTIVVANVSFYVRSAPTVDASFICLILLRFVRVGRSHVINVCVAVRS
ncbi:MAG: hypothetical protein IIY32_04435 [Thermoguttaceae bacterium]|nr:hypothetical protein [Thermoguttaceae bacterium]